MLRWLAAIAIALAATAGLGPLEQPAYAEDDQVDLLLVLAADVSRSVDEKKFRLQREGYATAIVDPRVVRAMTGGPRGRIALCFVEWASNTEQAVVVDWTPVGSAAEAEGVAGRVRQAPRAFLGRTSISAAIDYSLALLGRSPFQAPRRVIDVSGDGTNNSGRSVTEARDEAIAAGLTINGLVILSEVPLPTNPLHTHPPGGLTAYYENNVIGGPGAFVVEAQSFESFGQSLISKLVKEIALALPRARAAEREGARSSHPRHSRERERVSGNPPTSATVEFGVGFPRRASLGGNDGACGSLLCPHLSPAVAAVAYCVPPRLARLPLEGRSHGTAGGPRKGDTVRTRALGAR